MPALTGRGDDRGLCAVPDNPSPMQTSALFIGIGHLLPPLRPDARMAIRMLTQDHVRPRVGIPWHATSEEAANGRVKCHKYLRAVERAGGEPVLVVFTSANGDLKRQAAELDAFLLPGSPADIDPGHFHAKRHPATVDADLAREKADFALLEHAFARHKPVLAICYGAQSLNVFLGGSLIQDIQSELGSEICHTSLSELTGGKIRQRDSFHDAQFEAGRVLDLSGATEAKVNSSHHQAILEPGRGLRVAARAPDGVVEAVEWIGDSNWVIGVQWHPERMPEDALAGALFRGLLAAASNAQAAK
jgi:putative glutamine amidotransferase